jgi:hypothetical protein
LNNGDWGLGIGDWGLGIGDWGLGPIPNPQSPIPISVIFNYKIINLIIKIIDFRFFVEIFKKSK